MTTPATKFKETEIGLIPEEWDVFNIGQLGKVVTGKTPARENSDDWGDGVDFVTPSDITLDEKYLSTVSRKISKIGSDRFKNMLIPAGSVMVTCIGSDMGKVVMNRKISLTNQQINSLIVKKDFDNNFVFYSLKNLYQTFWEYAGGGSTMPIVNKSAFESIGTAVPRSIDEQKQISEILSSLDDKIELNRKINANLESLVSTLFKKWFVDIGDELPEGWKITELKNILELNYGKALKAEDRVSGKIKVYGSSGIVGLNDKKLVDGPGIIVGRKGNVGSVFWSNDDFYAIDTTYYVKSKLPLTYCYYLLKNQTFVNGDSVVPGLNRDQAYRTEVVLPSIDMLEKFDTIASDLIKSMGIIDHETKNLCLIRDSLLPRLMSGKIRTKTL